jgi:endonuclease/exonuclease/phosphatase family metal-dependent hydrolase
MATFNVLHGRVLQDGPPGSAESPLVEAVASLDADVLALQEVDRLQERSGRVDQARVAAAASGAADWRGAAAVHGRPVPGHGWVLDPAEPGLRIYGPAQAGAADDVPSHGIALLSRFPVREWRARRFAPAPCGLPLRVPGRPGLTLVRDQPRAALAAVLGGPQGQFTAVAVHLSFVPGWNIAQLLAVREWIAELPRPHVVLGDFNLVGGVPRAVLGMAELATRRRRARPDRWRDLARRPTYPSTRPVVQFDHILAAGTGPYAVSAVHTPRTPVSDHRPLVVDLELR